MSKKKKIVREFPKGVHIRRKINGKYYNLDVLKDIQYLISRYGANLVNLVKDQEAIDYVNKKLKLHKVT